MKSLLRYYLINLVSLWLTAQIIRGLYFNDDLRTLLIGAALFTVINILLVPLIRILLLPLNILTLGLFAWLTNVLALYALTVVFPQFKLMPYNFPGYTYQGFTIPAADLSTLWVAIVASFLIGLFTHLIHWLMH